MVDEHGGKEGLYAVIVDREVQALISAPVIANFERLILENATPGPPRDISSNDDRFPA